jgi:hypothetical protein
MSNTNAEILQALVSDDGDIAVLRGPSHEYKEHISCAARMAARWGPPYFVPEKRSMTW